MGHDPRPSRVEAPPGGFTRPLLSRGNSPGAVRPSHHLPAHGICISQVGALRLKCNDTVKVKELLAGDHGIHSQPLSPAPPSLPKALTHPGPSQWCPSQWCPQGEETGGKMTGNLCQGQ